MLLPLPPQCWNTVMCHYIGFMWCWGLNPELHTCYVVFMHARWALYQLSYSPFRSIWLYVYQRLACIYVCAPPACPVSAEVRRKHQIPGIGVVDGSEPWCGVWELSLRALLLTLEPSLQPLFSFRRLCVNLQQAICGLWSKNIYKLLPERVYQPLD